MNFVHFEYAERAALSLDQTDNLNDFLDPIYLCVHFYYFDVNLLDNKQIQVMLEWFSSKLQIHQRFHLWKPSKYSGYHFQNVEGFVDLLYYTLFHYMQSVALLHVLIVLNLGPLFGWKFPLSLFFFVSRQSNSCFVERWSIFAGQVVEGLYLM